MSDCAICEIECLVRGTTLYWRRRGDGRWRSVISSVYFLALAFFFICLTVCPPPLCPSRTSSFAAETQRIFSLLNQWRTSALIGGGKWTSDTLPRRTWRWVRQANDIYTSMISILNLLQQSCKLLVCACTFLKHKSRFKWNYSIHPGPSLPSPLLLSPLLSSLLLSPPLPSLLFPPISSPPISSPSPPPFSYRIALKRNMIWLISSLITMALRLGWWTMGWYEVSIDEDWSTSTYPSRMRTWLSVSKMPEWAASFVVSTFLVGSQ